MTLSDLMMPPRRGQSLPAAVRAVIVGAAWLPLLVSLFYVQQRCCPIYDNWQVFEEEHEPPALTVWVLQLSRRNADSHGLPFLAFLLLLLFGDFVMARTVGGRKHRGSLYRLWFAVVVLLGLVAFLLCMAAVLVPLWDKSST